MLIFAVTIEPAQINSSQPITYPSDIIPAKIIGGCRGVAAAVAGDDDDGLSQWTKAD